MVIELLSLCGYRIDVHKNKMIENNDRVLSNNFILEQSRIVDKFIIAYKNKKRLIIISLN